MNRGAIKTRKSGLVALWVPRELLTEIDMEVRRIDTDRSKLIRVAIREKLAREKEAA